MEDNMQGPNPLNLIGSVTELTESELNILYSYLESNLDKMSGTEIELWLNILEKIDPNLNE